MEEDNFLKYCAIASIIVITICMLKDFISVGVATPLILLCGLFIPKKKANQSSNNSDSENKNPK